MLGNNENLGDVWTGQLADAAAPLFDLQQNATAFKGLQDHCEKLAAPVVDRLIGGEIRAGILSCVKRGSNALGVDVPAMTLGTDAFERLRQWLKAQGLRYSVSEFSVASGGEVRAHLSIQPDEPG